MPNPIMFTEAAFLYGPPFATPRERWNRPPTEIETYARMQGFDLSRIGPATLNGARQRCSGCACRKACRRWLRTGVFNYSGDPRCLNRSLLEQTS
jgi:hypothetical protein